jgi:WD40 repeat protein
MVAALDADRTAWVRDLATGAPLLELPPCANPIAFTPDGAALVTEGRGLCQGTGLPPGNEVPSGVVDTASGDRLLDLAKGGTSSPFKAVFNPGGVFTPGRYLVSAAQPEGDLEIYDIASGELMSTLEFEGDWPLSLAFDSTGRYVAGGNQNGSAWVLDLRAVVEGTRAQDALVFHRSVDNGGIPGVSLNASGILATSAFNSLRLWDIHSGELVAEIPVEIDTPPYADFNPDGSLLYYIDQPAGSSRHVLRTFPLEVDRLVDLAETRVTRDLTDDECRRYLDPDTCE